MFLFFHLLTGTIASNFIRDKAKGSNLVPISILGGT